MKLIQTEIAEMGCVCQQLNGLHRPLPKGLGQGSGKPAARVDAGQVSTRAALLNSRVLIDVDNPEVLKGKHMVLHTEVDHPFKNSPELGYGMTASATSLGFISSKWGGGAGGRAIIRLW